MMLTELSNHHIEKAIAAIGKVLNQDSQKEWGSEQNLGTNTVQSKKKERKKPGKY